MIRLNRADHPRPLLLTDATRTLWTQHEQANRRAADMYRRTPIALNHLGGFTDCNGCGRKTAAIHGWCNKCWRSR